MKESERTRFLKKLYKDETKALLYEEYENNNIRLLRTYILLNDEFSTLLRLDTIGIYSEDKIKYIESLNYKNIKDEDVRRTLKI